MAVRKEEELRTIQELSDQNTALPKACRIGVERLGQIVGIATQRRAWIWAIHDSLAQLLPLVVLLIRMEPYSVRKRSSSLRAGTFNFLREYFAARDLQWVNNQSDLYYWYNLARYSLNSGKKAIESSLVFEKKK